MNMMPVGDMTEAKRMEHEPLSTNNIYIEEDSRVPRKQVIEFRY